MSAISWIKIRVDMFSDEKIRFIEQLPEADGILVIWVKLLALAGEKNMGGEIFVNDELPYTDEMLAAIFHRRVNTVRQALETFQRFRMIEIAPDRTIIICNWAKHQSVDRMEKIRMQNAESSKRYRLKQRQSMADRHLTRQMTLPDASCSTAMTVMPQIKSKNKNKNKKIEEPPTVPPKEGTNAHSDFDEAKQWLSDLFGRKRAWSDDEETLLNGLVPISPEDRDLIHWGYSLPRDSEGWALVCDTRATKPKQSLIVLLREFGSEVDKWRSVQKQLGPDESSLSVSRRQPQPEPEGWHDAAYQLYGEWVRLPPSFWDLPVDVQDDVRKKLEEQQQNLEAGVDAANPISGTFSNLADGSTFTSTGGTTFKASYEGGTGNDLTLTVQ